MITAILSFFGNAFSLFGKLTDFIEKRKFENEVKNKYEEKKRNDALEEDKKSKELIDSANEKSNQAQEDINTVKTVKIEDAKLTDEQVKTELESIEDPKEKKKREKQVKLAKEIKENADKKQAEIEKDAKFNAGDDISFKG